MAIRYTYVLAGDPTPLFRAKPVYNKRKMYDSQRAQKLVTGINLSNQHNDRPILDGPISLEAVFYMPIPKSRAKEEAFLLGRHHFMRPDLSNLLKYIEDAANTILYRDDCLIAKVTMEKVYGEPRTEFTIEKLES